MFVFVFMFVCVCEFVPHDPVSFEAPLLSGVCARDAVCVWVFERECACVCVCAC